MGISTGAGAKKAGGGKKLTKEQLALEMARAVGAGKPASVETVDFADPNRPKVCLEVDFPMLPINQIAAIEGNAGKPIYQMSKWWARRRSSVFRSLLLSASMKAPDDPAEAARAVWDAYYNNHQKKGALKHLRVADIFMGGGTTLVEGSRLGMQMLGTDLNPVAWFVVKNELAKVDRTEVEQLLAAVEAEVKPQIMPFYACDCPRGHKGTWTRLSTGETMNESFDPLALAPAARADFRYHGPEIICVFWAKHGPCQVTGCGHCTPIMPSPVVAVKSLTVGVWPDCRCNKCGSYFDIEDSDARMAPGVPLVIGDGVAPFAVLDRRGGVTCPSCAYYESIPALSGKARRKRIELSLLIDPEWLVGEGAEHPKESWFTRRADRLGLYEVRGVLPVECSVGENGRVLSTSRGTVPRKSHFECGACGTSQDILTSARGHGAEMPFAPYAIQGHCPTCEHDRQPYDGRFFTPAGVGRLFSVADKEWAERSEGDLADYWPRSELPYGLEADFWGVRDHGFSHWSRMFNSRQLLMHAQLLRAIHRAGPASTSWEAREPVLSAFQSYLRNQCMFTIWNIQRDTLEPHFSKNNFRPKTNTVENNFSHKLGRGNWRSCVEGMREALDWCDSPWELVPKVALPPAIAAEVKTVSAKQRTGDPVGDAEIRCASATDLEHVPNATVDLVITDPPFGGLLQYAELSDFFYVWLRLVLADRYPSLFSAEHTPKTLEAVENRARQPEHPERFYSRVLTDCWREAERILKPGGLLAFTFHHSEDEPWVAVLESLFEAGFYLEATYPIRSDETKGDNAEFGAQKIEYDIIHVCRRRTEEPTPVSWARMRRRVLDDVRQLQTVLENHAAAGLPSADLKVIKRGKALEYYSRHYGKVYVDEGRPFSVRDALVGINQLLDEEAGAVKEPPPGHAEPFTRQFLSLFRGITELPRDQVQKDLRGTGYTPAELVERGWCTEERKTFHVKEPRALAGEWYRRHRRNLTSDYDQAVVLIGAALDGSGINIRETLANENFRPHPALKALLDWHTRHGATKDIRAAAQRALAIYATWEQEHPTTAAQLTFFAE